jgi:hypothetical protein
MGFEKVEFEFPHESEDDALEVENSSAVEIDLSGNKTEDEYRDEQEVEVEDDDLDIEVVDDTPEEDQGREASAPPEEVTDEELEGYSSKVRKRINKIQKGYHDERRAKEAAAREREEAVSFAKQLSEENKKLKGDISKNREVLLEQAKRSTAVEVLAAKKQYKDAYDAGDSEKVLEAQDKLTSAKIKADKLANFEPEPLQEDNNDVTMQDTSPQQQVDTKAQAWAERNTWFQQDEEMTQLAFGLHNKLVAEGIDPTSDEYYERIDSRVQQLFPEKFEDAPKKKRANVVASASRSTAAKKVKLKASQVQLAKRLGLTNEQYARQLMKETRND